MHRSLLAAALLAAAPVAANAGAAGEAATTAAATKPGSAAAAPSPAACMKTVNAIGASMGGAEAKETSSGTNLHFVVRANGVDYDVICDPATGVVSDVAKRSLPLSN